MSNPQRAHLHRLRDVWIKSPIYFLTVCTHQRRALLTQPGIPVILGAAWKNSSEISGWAVGRFVIMPDHVHFFARAEPEAKPLSAFIRDWKKWTARQILSATHATSPLWQAEFFDHVLRSTASYAEKWEYVRLNPVRAGLVVRPKIGRTPGNAKA